MRAGPRGFCPPRSSEAVNFGGPLSRSTASTSILPLHICSLRLLIHRLLLNKDVSTRCARTRNNKRKYVLRWPEASSPNRLFEGGHNKKADQRANWGKTPLCEFAASTNTPATGPKFPSRRPQNSLSGLTSLQHSHLIFYQHSLRSDNVIFSRRARFTARAPLKNRLTARARSVRHTTKVCAPVG